MDPFSITTGVLALVGHCIKGLDIIHTYSSELQRAELNIRLLSTECATLKLALAEIDRLYANKTHFTRGKQKKGSDNGKEEGVRIVLADCEQQFKILLEKLAPFVELVESPELGKDKMGIRARISSTWNRQDIDFLRQCIQRQAELVNLLLTTLQHQSIREIHEIVQGSTKFQQLLKQSDHDTRSLWTAHEKGREKSLYYPGEGLSTTGTEPSVIGDEEFPFDGELINTLAYRRVFDARRRGTSSLEPQTPPSPASSSKQTGSGFSKLFRRGVKREESRGSASSSQNTPVPAPSSPTTPVPPAVTKSLATTYDEVLLSDGYNEILSAQTVRDAKTKFRAALALHREIVAMTFADRRYKDVVADKVARRDAMIKEVGNALPRGEMSELVARGLTEDEVKEIMYILEAQERIIKAMGGM